MQYKHNTPEQTYQTNSANHSILNQSTLRSPSWICTFCVVNQSNKVPMQSCQYFHFLHWMFTFWVVYLEGVPPSFLASVHSKVTMQRTPFFLAMQVTCLGAARLFKGAGNTKGARLMAPTLLPTKQLLRLAMLRDWKRRTPNPVSENEDEGRRNMLMES